MALPMVPHRGNSGTPSGMGSTFDPNECAAPLPAQSSPPCGGVAERGAAMPPRLTRRIPVDDGRCLAMGT